MTAFYTFRMIYLTFHRSWRGPAEAWHHVHESGWTMVAPLVILAVPTALAGLLLGIPPESGAIHTWLEEVFHGAEELGTGILPGSIAAEARPGGEAHGFELSRARRPAPAHRRRRGRGRHPPRPPLVRPGPGGAGPLRGAHPVRPRGPGMYRASVNKYYFDDLYQLLFARGGVLVSNALWWFDVKVMDGIVNGTGWLAERIGGILRRLQTGRVQNYGLGIAAGLVIVLLVYATVVR